MRIGVISLTKGGRETGRRIREALGEHEVVLYAKKEYAAEGDKELRLPLGEFVGELVRVFDALVFVTAVGVAVRALAKHLRGKHADPGVLVVDEAAKHVISVLSGHRVANELARTVASRLGAEAVITTSTGVQGKLCVEELADKLGLVIDSGDVKTLNAAIANRRTVEVFSDIKLDQLPGGFKLKPWKNLPRSRNPRVIITNKLVEAGEGSVVLRPRNLILGLGARRGASRDMLLEAVEEGLRKLGLSWKSVKALATLEERAGEEGFIAAAEALGVPLIGVSKEAIKGVEKEYAASEFVRARVGVGAVCEPCAVLAGENAVLIAGKTRFKGVTLAVAEETGIEKGKIFLVGIGPGSLEHITPRAVKVLREAEVVVSYEGYLRYIRELVRGKEVVSRGMGREVERAKIALGKALEGKKVAVVSSGDPGIYAMASVVLECAREAGVKPRVEVIPGVTSASAAAALLGAPLGHDFAVISLSDLLTPWGVIEKRLEAAAEGDYCIVLYNPRSRGRRKQLRRAVEVLRKHRKASTPVGIVRNAARPGEKVVITTLGELLNHEVDMRSIVIVGSSRSFVHHKWIVTPRGYREKYLEMMR